MVSIRTMKLVLVAVIALPACGCFSLPSASYYYPSDLVPASRQAFAWPAPDSADFRFLAQNDSCGLANWNGLADQWKVESDWKQIHSFAAEASSLTVLLRADTDPVVRERATSMLAKLGRELPGLSTHCVVVNADLGWVRNGIGLHRVLSDQLAFHATNMPPDFGSGIASALVKYISTEGTPDFVVVPLAPGSDRFALYGDLRTDGAGSAMTECTGAEALGLLQTRLLDPQTRRAIDERMDSAPMWVMPSERTEHVFVAVLMPHDTPAESRADCERLTRDLCSATLAPITVALANTCWDWSECTSGEFVRGWVPTDSVSSIMTGPVQQFGVLQAPLWERR